MEQHKEKGVGMAGKNVVLVGGMSHGFELREEGS